MKFWEPLRSAYKELLKLETVEKAMALSSLLLLHIEPLLDTLDAQADQIERLQTRITELESNHAQPVLDHIVGTYHKGLDDEEFASRVIADLKKEGWL